MDSVNGLSTNHPRMLGEQPYSKVRTNGLYLKQDVQKEQRKKWSDEESDTHHPKRS